MTIEARSADIQAYVGAIGYKGFEVEVTKDDVAYPDNTYVVTARVIDQNGDFVKDLVMTYSDDGSFYYNWVSGDLATAGYYYIILMFTKSGVLEAVSEKITLNVSELPSSS